MGNSGDAIASGLIEPSTCSTAASFIDASASFLEPESSTPAPTVANFFWLLVLYIKLFLSLECASSAT